jgi:23S rRNA (guanosine2251-2'-O)-methyltransferase
MGRSGQKSDARRPGRDSDRGGSSGPEKLTGVHASMEAIRAQRRKLRVLRVREGRPRPEVAAVVAAAREAGIPVESIGDPQFAEFAAGAGNPQGVVLEAEPLPELSLEGLLQSIEAKNPTLVALDGVEDPQNLGAIARVAEAAGVSGMVLPRRRCAPLSPAVGRASAGAIEWLPCARIPNLFELPDRALEGKRVVVFGAEGRGLRRGVEKEIDYRVRIPLGGRVASLNVSSAAAVFLFELNRRSK